MRENWTHDPRRALAYFEKAFSIDRTYLEKKNAEKKIRQCLSRLGWPR